jgi:tRNA (cmo5U34)-methyltransferase
MSEVEGNIRAENAGWTFEGIEDEFDEHVRRSVPLYAEGHHLVCGLTDFFTPPDTTITEIGASTGVLTEKVLGHLVNRPDVRYVAVDRVASMLDLARRRLADDQRAEFVVDELANYEFSQSSMVISYYTLQFVPPRVRQDVVNRIYECLDWGGAFVLFEKVRAPDARFQDLTMQLYHDFKRDQGFSEEDILNKQRSLKGVLEPFSTQGNLDLMGRAGFADIVTIMKSICFEGFLAIK